MVERGGLTSPQLWAKAGSVEMLDQWLSYDGEWLSEEQRRGLLPDVHHARSLSRALIVAADTIGASSTSPLGFSVRRGPALGGLQSAIEERIERLLAA